MPPKNRQDANPLDVLSLIKELIVQNRWIFSEHIQLYLGEEGFQISDMAQCILSATAIHKIEPDTLGSIDGNKYTIYGRDTMGQPFYTCGKLILRANQRVYFFITAHRRC